MRATQAVMMTASDGSSSRSTVHWSNCHSPPSSQPQPIWKMSG